MALTDIGDPTKYKWFDKEIKEVVTSTEFGKGKDNTNTMIQKNGKC